VITAFHVIEQLPDPREMVRALAARLKDGGRLVIEVPSSEDALLTLYENDAFQRFTYWSQQLFLFNTETLRRLAEQAGLRVVSIQQFQRYPLSNHLHWLSRDRPGGHQHWSFLDTPGVGRGPCGLTRCYRQVRHDLRLLGKHVRSTGEDVVDTASARW
jgi:hypothetical protein